MRHLSSIVLAAAVVAAGTIACFSDPTSGLRNGPTRILLTRSAVTLMTGDSIAVQAEVKDEQGNTYDAGTLAWTTDNASVAVVAKDTGTYVPYGAFSKAFVRGVSPAAAVANVTATYGGLTASIRVLVMPLRLTAMATPAVSGTASADTVGGVVISAGDTVTITAAAASNLTFNTNSAVHFGADAAYLVSQTATALKVLARGKPYVGRPWVTHLTYNGGTEVGTVAIDSLQSDSITVVRPRYRGTVTQLGDTMFLARQTGTQFSTSSVVRFGAASAVVLAKDSLSLKVISPANYTGVVTVTAVKVGAATVDSLKSTGSYSINQAAFGGTVVTAGKLLDTVKVYGTAITKFTTTPAGSVSNITIGGQAAWVLLRTADSMYVISKMPSTGQISVSNVNVGGTVIPSLATAGNVVITELPSGELNEPANDNPDVVTISPDWATITSANPYVLYGAIDDNTDLDDFFAFTLSAARNVTIQLQFAGTGGGGATNPDIDLLVCTVGCASWVSTAGATGAQPENITLTSQAAGTYNIYVNGWDTGGTTRPYKLIIY